MDLLKKELRRKHTKGTVGTGAMSDPYTPVEKKYGLTRQALMVIADHRFPVNITTKSNLVLRDVEVLQEISKIHASVSFTITTTDDLLASKIEPFAPSPSARFKAMGVLSVLGICTGVTMMPILPFIEDQADNIIEIIKKAKEYGAQYIYPAFGMTLRDRQRTYYYNKLDELFPGLRPKYEQRFGTRYGCSANNAAKLKEVFQEACLKYSVSTKIPTYESKVSAMQLSLFQEKRP